MTFFILDFLSNKIYKKRMKGMLLISIAALAMISCSTAKKLPVDVLEIERTPDKLVVHFFDDREDFFTVASKFDYKSRYSALKNIALSEPKVSIVDNYGVSLLAYAAANGDTELVASLLEQGEILILDDPDREENPPVYLAKHPIELAIRYGHYDILKLLLEHGYKPCCVVDCIGLDRLDMLKLLNAYGARIGDNSISWAAPLVCYAQSGTMVEYLVSKGCSIHKAIAYSRANDSKETFTKLEQAIKLSKYKKKAKRSFGL